MEIIVFALLAGYLFFRLWNVLGMRTGSERPFDPTKNNPFEKLKPEPIVVMPKSTGKETAPITKDLEKAEDLKKLTVFMPDFKVDEFLGAAERAFRMIIKAYSQGNQADLKALVEETVYQSFLKAISEREAKKINLETEIDFVQAELLTINLTEQTANLTVRFKSEQMVAHIDEKGVSLDNPAKLRISLVDVWTFERSFSTSSGDPTWILIKTSAEVKK